MLCLEEIVELENRCSSLQLFHELFCSSLNINQTYSERPKSFRGAACRGLPALLPCVPGRARTPVRAAAGPRRIR